MLIGDQARPAAQIVKAGVVEGGDGMEEADADGFWQGKVLNKYKKA